MAAERPLVARCDRQHARRPRCTDAVSVSAPTPERPDRSPDLLLAPEAAATRIRLVSWWPTVRFAVVVGEAPQPKPLLLLDVDGVLNPFRETPEGYREYDLFTADDEPVRLSPRHGSGWENSRVRLRSYGHLRGARPPTNSSARSSAFSALPVIAFPPVPFEPREKVPAVATFTADRAAAWVDDILERLFMCHTGVAPSD